MRRLLLLAVVLLLNACTDTDIPGDQEKNNVLLELRPYAPSFLEIAPIQTRAFPVDYGYYPYGDSRVNGQFEPQRNLLDAKARIHMLFYKDTDGSLEEDAFFKSGDSWRSRVEMESNAYYLYGFIPDMGTVNNITFPYDNDFRKGIRFTINKMESITPSDVCVTVAAGRGDDTKPDDDFAIGKFRFQVNAAAEKNYVYLLFDHIYASLCFSFKVDAEYNKLRTIRIKKLRLSNMSLKRYYDATVTLTANSNNPLTVSFVGNGTEMADGDNVGVLFEANENVDPVVEPVTLTTSASKFIGCFVPGLSDTSSFTLETTYDVYDKNTTTAHPEGNLVRKNCVATNSINVKGIIPWSSTWEKGVMVMINLKVDPTYLYMLSEPDLDNPTVTLVPPTGSGS